MITTATSTKTLHNRSLLEDLHRYAEVDDIWIKIRQEAKFDIGREPIISVYYHASIVSQQSLEAALANTLLVKLISLNLLSDTVFDLFNNVLEEHPEIVELVKQNCFFTLIAG
ncbi:hypothetical protein Bca52824_002639 [Brassica carinata]|uniref:Serine acetyltransferase N-terminal domain-containing protein n=1 Tax=Brassica carinata TaxID=52824 RepID=A0A8X7WKK5_BRACI|nr:hypothetical protein Bca52824_002639 [Brassica carinata]